MAAPKAIEGLSFEEALTELESLVRNLETGKSPLEKSIDDYQRGVQLKEHCAKKLRDAQAKIEKITVSKDGKIKTQPLDKED
jgi:exodeoxyribonuclease VII small subunit